MTCQRIPRGFVGRVAHYGQFRRNCMKNFAKISKVRKSLRQGSELMNDSMGKVIAGLADTLDPIVSKLCPYLNAKYSCPYINVDYSCPYNNQCYNVSKYSSPTGTAESPADSTE